MTQALRTRTRLGRRHDDRDAGSATGSTEQQPHADRRVRWPDWAPRAAPAWSLGYAALGAVWVLGGPGFPFGTANDPGAVVSILRGASPEVGAPLIVALGLAGAVVGGVMARPSPRADAARLVLLAFAWTAAVGLCLVVPDYRVLAATAYTPIVVLGAPFGWPPGASVLDLFPWTVLNQVVCIAGGMLWAAAAVAYQRRTRDACGACGRGQTTPAWTTPAAAARWGRWAVAVAVAVPLVYAATRFAWALGIPLGIDEAFYREGQESGLWIAGAALGALAVGGAVLTLGLAQRWGEVFPGWIPVLRGRRVPARLVTVPASIVAVLVTMAGLMFIRLQTSGVLGDLFGFGEDSWAAIGPELLWPLWGVALGAATLAYHYRRRGPCRRCGGDQTAPPPASACPR